MVAKQVLFVIAQNGFRDEEFSEPKKVLESKGYKAVVASKTTSEAKGALGMRVKPDISIDDALKQIDSFSGVVFVGGPGSSAYFNDRSALSLAKTAVQKGMAVAAICIAPVILANAGLLNGIEATVFPSETKAILAKGARYVNKSVVVSGKIITANGPGAALEFGKAIATALG